MTTPESIKSGIESGLTCESVEVIGDGQHFQAVIVSASNVKVDEAPRASALVDDAAATMLTAVEDIIDFARIDVIPTSQYDF